MRKSWRRPTLLRSPEPFERYDVAQAVHVDGADQLLAIQPRLIRSLSTELDVQALSTRVCPVLMADHSVAILALAEYVGGDQADELARCIVSGGYALAKPQRYILSAPLLLAISRGQVIGQGLSGHEPTSPERSRTALVNAFDDIIEWGVRHGASDVHINIRSQENESEVRFTLGGRYIAPERFCRIPTSTLVDMLAVAWMEVRGGNGAVFDPLVEQQGSIVKQVGGRHVLLRWASLAADAGPSVCLRILQRDAVGQSLTLQNLGYLPHQDAIIERAVKTPGGAVVFAGTVGSGKSTTLAALVAQIPSHRKVITIEDPVEYRIPNAIQNTIARDLRHTAHDDYASKLRTLKRSAMDDVLLGEVRDRETGRAFMDLAGSGVGVYTSTHAPSAALIPQRLASEFIGVSRDFLALPGMLKLLVYQVLLPALCPHCRLDASSLMTTSSPMDVFASGKSTSESRYAWLHTLQRCYGCDEEKFHFRNPEGCDSCRQEQAPELYGYAGRTVAAECLEPLRMPAFLRAIREFDLPPELQGAAAEPFPGVADAALCRSALHAAMYKVMQGLIDPRDVELRFGPYEPAPGRAFEPKTRLGVVAPDSSDRGGESACS